MKQIITCTPQSETHMNRVISEGFKLGLHFENTDAPNGLAVFVKSPLEIKPVLARFGRQFDMVMLAKYGDSVQQETEIARGIPEIIRKIEE